MSITKRVAKQRLRRQHRVRRPLRRGLRPRLTVYRSNKHIYAQIIDDVEGKTLVSAATVEGELGGVGQANGNTEAAKKVGAAIARRAAEKNITDVVFDRGLYRYHGRIAALADAAREAGLNF